MTLASTSRSYYAVYCTKPYFIVTQKDNLKSFLKQYVPLLMQELMLHYFKIVVLLYVLRKAYN